MTDIEEYNKNYERAKDSVKKIKGFYTHLTFYIIINLVVLFVNTNFESQGFKSWSQWHLYVTPIFWGIGLLIHGIHVFNPFNMFSKKWEEKKIKEFMDEDDF